ncbi:MAG: hypothetical protein LBN42_02005 [Oscillospiraceae bacterium]|jgi:hypothetical protein|nr:hypothetical protein [Oscillospiraceae bacterium]
MAAKVNEKAPVKYKSLSVEEARAVIRARKAENQSPPKPPPPPVPKKNIPPKPPKIISPEKDTETVYSSSLSFNGSQIFAPKKSERVYVPDDWSDDDDYNTEALSDTALLSDKPDEPEQVAETETLSEPEQEILTEPEPAETETIPEPEPAQPVIETKTVTVIPVPEAVNEPYVETKTVNTHEVSETDTETVTEEPEVSEVPEVPAEPLESPYEPDLTADTDKFRKLPPDKRRQYISLIEMYLQTLQTANVTAMKDDKDKAAEKIRLQALLEADLALNPLAHIGEPVIVTDKEYNGYGGDRYDNEDDENEDLFPIENVLEAFERTKNAKTTVNKKGIFRSLKSKIKKGNK